MFHRCYNEKALAKRPTYRGCTVSEEWHNFQNFAEWFCSQPNHGKEGFQLEKDLTVLGNKVYGPATCSLAPIEVNSFLTGADSKASRDCPIGVHWNINQNCYIAMCHVDGKQELVGRSRDKMAAFQMYKAAKEKQAKVLAQRYGDVLSSVVYNNLMNYEVKED